MEEIRELRSVSPFFARALAAEHTLQDADLAAWNRAMRDLHGGGAPRFVAQDRALLADGLHYEERIALTGRIATRERSVHDAINAAVWLDHFALKRAMNRRQVADIARIGTKSRTRGQCALTHFDEAGAIVWLAEGVPLAAWDRHDWRALFLDARAAWGRTIGVSVIGHALFEYAIAHGALPVAKALAIWVGADELAARACDGTVVASWPDAENAVAAAIEDGRLLADPQDLRPLPLAGIPGWQPGSDDEAFYAAQPCFRPLREGRRYPAPFPIERRQA